MAVDLLFPAFGDCLPADHAYPLYAALAVTVPAFHNPAADVRFAPLGGPRDAPGLIRLPPYARLRVRLPEERIRLVLPLAGKRLDVVGHSICLGVPTVVPLIPAPALSARLVTIKHADTPETFLTALRTKLNDLGVRGEPAIPLVGAGPHAGEPKRRVVRIKGKAVVGYALLVSGLTAEDSVRLQEVGLGGRTRIGCGFFGPVRE